MPDKKNQGKVTVNEDNETVSVAEIEEPIEENFVQQDEALESKSTKKAESKTTVDASSFEVVSVERRADKVVFNVRGEITVSPSQKDREKYLSMQVGSRAEFDVKPK